jgi:hypothetical protein
VSHNPTEKRVSELASPVSNGRQGVGIFKPLNLETEVWKFPEMAGLRARQYPQKTEI